METCDTNTTTLVATTNITISKPTAGDHKQQQATTDTHNDNTDDNDSVRKDTGSFRHSIPGGVTLRSKARPTKVGVKM